MSAEGIPSWAGRPPASPVRSTRGMVCTSHPLSAAAALAVLRDGGNAVDAAVAAANLEGVIWPDKCGLGGDAFALVYQARSRSVTAFTGCGAVPRAVSIDWYRERGHTRMPLTGPLSVSVPGAVGAYEAMVRRFGTRSLADLLQPAIRAAEDGFVVNERLAETTREKAPLLAACPEAAAIFLPSGVPPQTGSVLRQPQLAESLRSVAQGGATSFYQGELAERLVAALGAAGMPFTMEDFSDHETEVAPPLSVSYREWQVYETPPPSQGLMLLEMLNLVEGFDLGRLGNLSTEGIHTLVEAKKLAFADRMAWCGDPRVVTVPVEPLLSKPFAARRRGQIDPERAAEAPAGAPREELEGDTSYMAVADADGNAVSLIYSISLPYGAAWVAGDTGILLNNRAGRGFVLDPAHPNGLAPGKRTMHTLNAYLVLRDGEIELVGGTPGGDQQTQWSLQVLVGLLDGGLDVAQAVEMPRWHSFPGTDPEFAGRPFHLSVESRLPEESLAGLEGRGHRLVRRGPWDEGGAVQLVRFDRQAGVLEGASDPRAGGVALPL